MPALQDTDARAVNSQYLRCPRFKIRMPALQDRRTRITVLTETVCTAIKYADLDVERRFSLRARSSSRRQAVKRNGAARVR